MTPVLTMSHLSSNEGPCMEYFILRVAVPTPQIMGGYRLEDRLSGNTTENNQQETHRSKLLQDIANGSAVLDLASIAFGTVVQSPSALV